MLHDRKKALFQDFIEESQRQKYSLYIYRNFIVEGKINFEVGIPLFLFYIYIYTYIQN